MTTEEKIKAYKQKYGEDAPLPPDHMLDGLISDESDAFYEKFAAEHGEVLEELLRLAEGIPLDRNHPFWRKLSDPRDN